MLVLFELRNISNNISITREVILDAVPRSGEYVVNEDKTYKVGSVTWYPARSELPLIIQPYVKIVAFET